MPAKLTRAVKSEQDAACLDSIRRMEATRSPIVSDGEQHASSFATCPLADTLAGTGVADNLAADGQYFAISKHGSSDHARDIALRKLPLALKEPKWHPGNSDYDKSRSGK
jgi:hypothetical protein